MIFKKEMALTRKMFFDTLPRALDTNAFTVEKNTVTVIQGDRSLIITFGEKANFKLGGFAIPRADITLEFIDYSAADADQAMQRFQRYYHRGGG